MARTLFGTDGIRGKANTDPMTAGIALRLGQAAGLLFTRGEHRLQSSPPQLPGAAAENLASCAEQRLDGRASRHGVLGSAAGGR